MSGSPFAVYRSLADLPASIASTVAAVGNFDGVHCGHREILMSVAREARETGALALAITFDPHPERLLRPKKAPKLLTPMPVRLELLAHTGVDAVLVLPFNEELARMRARDFVRQVLVGRLHVCALHEGGNFRF